MPYHAKEGGATRFMRRERVERDGGFSEEDEPRRSRDTECNPRVGVCLLTPYHDGNRACDPPGDEVVHRPEEDQRRRRRRRDVIAGE